MSAAVAHHFADCSGFVADSLMAVDFHFLAEMPLYFPSLGGTRVVVALAMTTFAELKADEEEKKQQQSRPLMTFFTRKYLGQLRAQHPNRGNMHAILGFSELQNLTVSSPNGAHFGAAWREAEVDFVQPRLEYVQHYQTVHHSFLGDKELIPGSDYLLTSKFFCAVPHVPMAMGLALRILLSVVLAPMAMGPKLALLQLEQVLIDCGFVCVSELLTEHDFLHAEGDRVDSSPARIIQEEKRVAIDVAEQARAGRARPPNEILYFEEEEDPSIDAKASAAIVDAAAVLPESQAAAAASAADRSTAAASSRAAAQVIPAPAAANSDEPRLEGENKLLTSLEAELDLMQRRTSQFLEALR
jgi:hypothetical protein